MGLIEKMRSKNQRSGKVCQGAKVFRQTVQV